MVAYIIRRMLQSIGAIIIASLVLHTVILVYLPDRFMQDMIRSGRIIGAGDAGEEGHQRPPWPMEYLLWLFDPNDTTMVNRDFVEVPKGIDWTIGSLRIRGSGALTGDFGFSGVGQGATVSEVISTRWGNTLALVLAALIPTLLIAVPLGIIAAARQRSKLDHTLTLASFVGLSMPPYWLGLMLILFLAVIAKNLHDTNGWSWLPYLPPGDVRAAGGEDTLLDHLYHLVLPASTLAFAQIAGISRHVRFAMLEVMRKDYVRTAWAKGLPERRVLFRHAFRNAIIPVITTITLALPALVSGTVVIETVFGYAGMGQLFFKAMGGQLASSRLIAGTVDYELVMTLMLIMVVVVVLSNLLADILYVIFNPRMNTR
jgi:peptide/nickel transport system permease protein